MNIAVHGTYLHGFEQSLTLSLIASVIPGVFGLLLAYAIFTAKRGALLRQVVITASGVFANFGGVPLAFLFIASFGSTALVTGWLSNIGLNIYTMGFSLYTMSGVALVYMYFQIPLMVLIILPALEGLRPAWREAAENMGARSWQYWRYVGGPVLLPSFLSSVMLLFGSALAAYATAEALTAGTIPLTPIQIGTFLNGNVLAGQENVGDALALGMVIIIAGHHDLSTYSSSGGRRNGCGNRRARIGSGCAPAQARLVPGVALGDPAHRRRLLPAPALRGAAVRGPVGVRHRVHPGRLRLIAVAVGAAGGGDLARHDGADDPDHGLRPPAAARDCAACSKASRSCRSSSRRWCSSSACSR